MNAQHMDARWRLSIDVLEQKLIAGWAWDVTAPDRPVLIELTCTNGKKVVCLAEVFRKDLLDADIGTGKHGYEIDISTWDLIGHSLTIRPIAAGKDEVSVSATFDLTRMLHGKVWYQSYKNLMLSLMGPIQHCQGVENNP